MPTYKVTLSDGRIVYVNADSSDEAKKKVRQTHSAPATRAAVYDPSKPSRTEYQPKQRPETWGEYLDRGGKSPRYLDKRGKSTTER